MIALLVVTSVLAYNYDMNEYVTSEYDIDSDAIEFFPESDISELPEALQAKKCYKYQCKGSDIKMNKNQCVKYSKGTYHIQPCEGEKVCPPMNRPVYNPRNCVKQENNFRKSFPGEPCDSNRDCIEDTLCQSKQCTGDGCVTDSDKDDKDDKDDQDDQTEKYCLGGIAGAECETSSECHPGFYCHNSGQLCESSVCAAQKAVGEACESTFECVNSAGCYNSTCTAFFTVKTGVEIEPEDCDIKGRAPLCETYSCQAQSETNTTVCITAPTSVSQTFPLQCTASANCQGSNTVQNVQSACRCGFNNAGASYCDLFTGDTQYLDYVVKLKAFVASGIEQCNTLRRFDKACYELHSKLSSDSSLLDTAMYAEDYPLYQQNDVCVTEVYTREFVASMNSAFGLVAPIAMLIALLY